MQKTNAKTATLTLAIAYPLLSLTSCQLFLHQEKKSSNQAITQQAPFPNILENLEKSPPFGNPKLYKKWKIEQKKGHSKRVTTPKENPLTTKQNKRY